MQFYMRSVSASTRHFEIIDVTVINAPGSNVRALVDIRLAGARINGCRLITLPNGSPRLCGPQMRRGSPLAPHPVVHTVVPFTEADEREFGAAVTSYLQHWEKR